VVLTTPSLPAVGSYVLSITVRGNACGGAGNAAQSMFYGTAGFCYGAGSYTLLGAPTITFLNNGLVSGGTWAVSGSTLQLSLSQNGGQSMVVTTVYDYHISSNTQRV
jgi:hypothetical protein